MPQATVPPTARAVTGEKGFGAAHQARGGHAREGVSHADSGGAAWVGMGRAAHVASQDPTISKRLATVYSSCSVVTLSLCLDHVQIVLSISKGEGAKARSKRPNGLPNGLSLGLARNP